MDKAPCGKEVFFPELGTTMQPCPLSNPLTNGRIPVYLEPVPSPAGASLPPPDAGWLTGTEGKYFECDQVFTGAVYYHPQGWRNIWWARTLSEDKKQWGWVPEVFFTGGANDEPDFGLRNCPPPPPPPSPCDPVASDSGATLRAHFADGRRATTASFGKRARVRGRLTDSSGNPVPAASVCVAETEALKGAERRVADSITTDENGRFSYRLKRGPSRRLSFVYRAGGTLASGSVRVRVHAPVSLRAKDRSLHTGQTVVFRGSVGGRDHQAGVLVEMQVRRNGKWESLLGTTRTKKRGSFRDHYRFRFSEGVQHYSFRAHVPAQRAYPFTAGSSKPVRVKVRG